MTNLLERARELAERISPLAAGWEDARAMAETEIRAAIKSGFGSILVPAERGGHGAGHMMITEILETVASVDLGFAFALVVHNNLAASIAKRGTPAQIERYLAGMQDGTILGSFCLTEPGAGTDVAGIQTTAKRHGNGWRLNGAKAWITNAQAADLLCVYAQTDPAAGGSGIAAFLVERTHPGIIAEPQYKMLGCHSMGTGGFRIVDCDVDDSALFLPPGEGFKGAMAGIDAARVHVSGMCSGMLTTGLNAALTYAKERRAFGRSTLDFQGLQWMLADVATDLHTSRLLTYDAAAKLEVGRATLAAAHTKKFVTRVTLSGLSQCMQAMGAAGLSAERPLVRHFAAAKVAQYLDGTTEVQNIVISRVLSGGRYVPA